MLPGSVGSAQRQESAGSAGAVDDSWGMMSEMAALTALRSSRVYSWMIWMSMPRRATSSYCTTIKTNQ